MGGQLNRRLHRTLLILLNLMGLHKAAVDLVPMSADPPFREKTLLWCPFEDECDKMKVESDADSFDWRRHQGPTPTRGTGPAKDHTTDSPKGYMLYAEANDGRPNDTDVYKSEPLTPSVAGACLSFWYHLRGVHIGTISAMMNGVEIWNRTGPLDKNWYRAVVPLDTRHGEQFQVSFRAVRGSGEKGDIAIDDIHVVDASCPQLFEVTPEWGNWSTWTLCSVSCGDGTKTRVRECKKGRCVGNKEETVFCQDPACRALLAEWSHWGNCDVTCGTGYKKRTRLCLTGECKDNLFETAGCATGLLCRKKRQVASWSGWSGWSQCSASCGRGQQTRQRRCLNGVNCPGSPTSSRSCIRVACIVASWSGWSGWSQCSASCGRGQQTRQRRCLNGFNCPGSPTSNRSCNTVACTEMSL